LAGEVGKGEGGGLDSDRLEAGGWRLEAGGRWLGRRRLV